MKYANLMRYTKQMRQIALICGVLLVTCTGIGCSAESALTQSNTQTTHVVLWYIPHPDDETIGMAGAIQASRAAGNRNIVIFFTRGGSTMAGFMQGLGSGEIKTSRMQEALQALEHLGVLPSDILFFDFKDGFVSVESALAIMRAYREKYPAASHRTVSYTDSHSDHKALALALTQMQKEHQDLDAAYYQVYIYKKRPKDRVNENVVLEQVPNLAAKAAAIAAYINADPAEGTKAVGGKSVAKLMANALTDPYEYTDVAPPSFGMQPLYICIHGRNIGAAAEYINSSDWSLITRMDVGENNEFTIRLQKVLLAFPGKITVYTGSEYHIMSSLEVPSNNFETRSSLLVGLGLIGMVHMEYHLYLSEQLDSTGFVEFRWYPNWSSFTND